MGLRGSGKSTLGRGVAADLGLPFVDLDDVTTGLLGEGTLPELWARLGEAAFREAEVRALREQLQAAAASPRVVALGGGTPTAPGAAELLRQAGSRGRIVVVYLRGEPAVLRERLAETNISGRPSLTGAGTLAEIEQVFAARDPLYARLASHTLEIAGRSARDLARELAALSG